MGKYSHVIKGLPKLPPELGPKQDRIDAAKADFFNLSITELSAAYRKLRDEADELASQASNLDDRVTAAEQLIAERFEAEGVHQLNLDDGSAVRTDPQPYAGVVDKEAYRQWCIAQGLEHQMHLWPSTTQSLVKERLLNGESEPPGISVFVKTSVFCTGRGHK